MRTRFRRLGQGGFAVAVLALALTGGAARAQHEADEAEPLAPLSVGWSAKLTPPTMLRDSSPGSMALDLHSTNHRARHPLNLSLDLSVTYLRLAMHGDYKPGLAPFLGTSTEALGGFRLRF